MNKNETFRFLMHLSTKHFLTVTPTVHIREFPGSKEVSQKNRIVAFKPQFFELYEIFANAKHRDTGLGTDRLKKTTCNYFTKIKAKQFIHRNFCIHSEIRCATK